MPIHRTLFALAFAAILLARSGFLAGLWDLLPERGDAPVSTILEWDPDGATEEGPGLDPDGRS